MMVMPLHLIPPPPPPGCKVMFTFTERSHDDEPRRDCEWLPKPKVVERQRRGPPLLILEKNVTYVRLPEPPPPPSPEVYRR